MNEPINRETDDLAKVLNRISTLSQSSGAIGTSPESIVHENDIPVLEEVYDGKVGQEKPATFQQQALAVHEQVASSFDAQALLHELMPLLKVAIRQAVQQELEQVAEQLSARLENELLELMEQHVGADKPQP